MNEDSLLAEEAEPPSISPLSRGLNNSGTIFIPTPHTKFHPAYRLRQATIYPEEQAKLHPGDEEKSNG